MKHFDIITCLPDYFSLVETIGVTKEAFKKKIARLVVHDLRQYGQGAYKTIDDRPYGGGDGMILSPQPIAKAIEFCSPKNDQKSVRIYFSPQGVTLDQNLLFNIAHHYDHYILLCGRYGGVDQRVIDYFQFQEISLGDYILSGGELAALIFLDALLRLLPGVLGNQESIQNESFSKHPYLLEPPQYTRPPLWNGLKVPEVLLSGHHEKINQWKYQESLSITQKKRPDLFAKFMKTNK